MLAPRPADEALHQLAGRAGSCQSAGLLSLSGTPPGIRQPSGRRWPITLALSGADLVPCLALSAGHGRGRAAWANPCRGQESGERGGCSALLQRLQRLQLLSSGGFSLWDGRSDEEQWLTAYTADFLLCAQGGGRRSAGSNAQSGAEPAAGYLTDSQYGERWSSCPEHSRLAYQAYSAYVLAQVGERRSLPLRLIWEQQADHARSGFAALAPLAGPLGHGMSRTPPRPSAGPWRPGCRDDYLGITAHRFA